jgi:hypothetical protein
MLNNKDIWLSSEEVISRLEVIYKKLEDQRNETVASVD